MMLMYGVDLLLRFPDPCEQMLRVALQDERLTSRLGPADEIKRSWFWTGTVDATRVAVEIPLEGPKGKATLSARSVLINAETWQVVMMSAVFPDDLERPSIDLMESEENYNARVKAHDERIRLAKLEGEKKAEEDRLVREESEARMRARKELVAEETRGPDSQTA